MGAGCCKTVDTNPDGSPKDPQTKEQVKEDPRELRRYAIAADWAQMRILLRRMPIRQICSGASKDEVTDDELGNTALHFSVSINHLRGVKKLMRYGIPPVVRNKAGKTPLHLALETGKLKAAEILLERSMALRESAQATPPPFLINVKDSKGVSPLLAVVAAGRLKLAKEALALCRKLGVSVDLGTRDSQGNSLLLYAAKWGWFDELEGWAGGVGDSMELQKLLNTQNKQGETVLGHVLMFGASGLLPRQRASALVQKLLRLGAVARLPAFQERVPPLNLAAAADNKAVYDMLVGESADPLSARDALGRTPLHYAAAKGSKVLGEVLLTAGLKVYALDGQGNTPLHLASMRGHEAMVTLLLQKADDKMRALLTPNKAGLSAYHLALKAGPDDKAQNNSLSLIEQLGEQFTTPVLGRKKAVVDTPLLLAIQGHQDRVVKALLQKGCSPNEANARGELPLARVMSCATAATYDNDSAVFDLLVAAGANMAGASETAHPMLAICKNNLSKFAEKAVGVLTERCGRLDWNKRDEKGYTPLSLAAFHDNAWLVRYLVDEIKVDPNSPAQRSLSTEVEQVGTTGALCCTKPITVPGTVEGQTPLMCAAKGASLAAVQLLLNRGADVNAVDSLGRTALQHAMHLDKAASIKVAAALLQMGARPERGTQVRYDNGSRAWKQCEDLVGESWPHRAIRYGFSSFLGLWAACGGSLEILATTADDADDMPGAELKVEEKADFLDVVPRRVNNVLEDEDEELVDEYNGENSEEVQAAEDGEGDGSRQAPRAVGEGVEVEDAPGVARRRRSGAEGSSSDDDCGEDDELVAEMIARGEVESHYSGPTPRMMLRWRRRGVQWWNEFWVDPKSLPDPTLEGDPHWEDKYNICEEGDEFDEEDVEDEIWESIRAEQRAAANELRRRQQQQQRQRQADGGEGQQQDGGSSSGGEGASGGGEGAQQQQPQQQPEDASSLLARFGKGLTHRLFKHRLPGAAIPEENNDADDGTFAAGSPSKWLRRRSSTSQRGMLASFGVGGEEAPASSRAQQQGSPPKAPAGPVAESNESFGARRRPSRKDYERQSTNNNDGDMQVADVDDNDTATGGGGGGGSEGGTTSRASSQQDERAPLLAQQASSRRESTRSILRPSQQSMSDGPAMGGFVVVKPPSQGEERTGLLAPSSRRSHVVLPAEDPSQQQQGVDGTGPSRSSKSFRLSRSSSRVVSRQPSVAASGAERQKSFMSKAGVIMVANKLISGTKGDKLWANDSYFQPDNVWNGLPRYMSVDTQELPEETYEAHVANFEARLGGYTLKDEKLIEGPELRARNITWYHKSMSPTEYPLKIGKWKSFLRLGKKATEEAKLRRPRKPGEKPKIRSKKAWFGLPNLPSRPELALTSPLVYAVRLGRPKCVAELLKLSGSLINIPDAHGVTPLSYAMFMLAKDRNNKVVQQITDLLLKERPLVDSPTVWRLIMLPRLEKEVKAMEAEAAAQGGAENMSRRARKALQEKKELLVFLRDSYSAQYFPSVMEPVILAALLNDVGRLTVMVRTCGANINNAWVWLPDIPTYFRGLWEKQLGRCLSRCTALHVAICQKKYDTVRALLDLGSDPNQSGSEFSGNIKKDLARQAKLYQDKATDAARVKESGAKYNPYVKLWKDTRASLKEMFYSTKRFLSSIEIPGLTRPHPWLSPLHLACRFGLPEITYLLVQRGAAVNGGPAAACAPKSPLEEALLYARANAQAYGTTSERLNYRYILEMTCLEETESNREQIELAFAAQKKRLEELIAAVKAKAQRLEDSSPKDKNGRPTKKASDFLKQASKVIDVGGRLASYGPEDLKALPVPGMNVVALASKGMKLIKDALGMLDPIKASIKAVTLAAKIIVKILINMMRRPVALYDPAMACAHVMLYSRAPINPSEKQTGILVRDILDNGNGVPGAEVRVSYYRWLGIEPESVNDMVWIQTVINKVTVLKSNPEFGYIKMDLTISPKDYERYKKKFLAQVENAVVNYGFARMLPEYLMQVIDDASPGARADKAQVAEVLGGWIDTYVRSKRERAEALVREYKTVPEHKRESWLYQRSFGVVPTVPSDYDIAKELLPDWCQTAPPAAAGAEAAPAVEAGQEVFNTFPRTADEVKRFLVSRFISYDPETRKAVTFKEPPVGPDIWTQMLQGSPDNIAFEMPEVPDAELEAVRPTIADVTDADVCRAIVRAFNATVVKQAEERSRQLQEQSAGLSKRAADYYIRTQMKEKAENKVQRMAQYLEDSREPRLFDEGPIFVKALTDPMWEAAANKLGDGAASQALLRRLRQAQSRGEIPVIEDPLAFAKGLGEGSSELASEELVAKMEEKLGQPFGDTLRQDLLKIQQQAAESMRQQDSSVGQQGQQQQADALDETIDQAGEAALDLAENGPQDADAYLDMARSKFGDDVASMLKVLQQACESGELPVPQPESLAQDLVDGIKEMGPGAVVAVWESKTGMPLPEFVRQEVEKGAQTFASRIMEKYEQGGISAAIGACVLITAGVAAAVSTGIMDAAEARYDELVGGAQQAADTVADVVQGDMTLEDAMSGVSAEDMLALPVPKKVEATVAPVTSAIREANQALESLATTTKQLEETVRSLTAGATAELDSLSGQLASTMDKVAATVDTEVATASDQLMAGLELMMEVDMQALADALEDAREVLVMIMDTLCIDEVV